MAYDYLNDQMDESNRVQADYQARNPVIPNTPRTPDSVYGDPGSGALIPVNSPPTDDTSGVPQFLRDPLGAVNNVVNPDSTSAQSYRNNATVDPSLTQPRLSPMVSNGTQPATMTSDVLAQPAISAPPPSAGGPITAAAAKAPDFLSGVYNNPQEIEYARQNAAYRAQDKMDENDKYVRQRAQGAAAGASQDLDRLNGEKRVADAKAQWRAYDAAGNIGGPGRYEALAAAQANAAAVNGDIAATKGARTAADAQYNGTLNRDYLGENLKIQASEDQAKRTGILDRGQRYDQTTRALDNEGKAIDNAGKKLTQQQQQQVTDLRARLTAETDPAKARALARQIATLMGHPPQDKYIPIESEGPPDALGQPTKIKDTVFNSDTQQFLKAPKQAEVAPPPANHIAALKANPKLADQYDAKYGKGEAKKILDAMTGK